MKKKILCVYIVYVFIRKILVLFCKEMMKNCNDICRKERVCNKIIYVFNCICLKN